MAKIDDMDISPESLTAALAFHRSCGVDATLGAVARNRYQEFLESSSPAKSSQTVAPPQRLASSPRPDADFESLASNISPSVSTSPSPSQSPSAPSRPPPTQNFSRATHFIEEVDKVVATAAQLAQSSNDLDALRAALEQFDGCALKATASRLVFEDGARGARVMAVGEAPGADEDREGRPFVGRAGRLLDKMLASIGMDRTQVYIANIVPWRPPGNRTPTPQEAAICLPFIRRQIELSAPDFLICLGAPSMQALLEIREGILKSRGVWRLYSCAQRKIPAMAMLHPAYLLRQSAQKKWAWRDLRQIRRALDGETPAV